MKIIELKENYMRKENILSDRIIKIGIWNKGKRIIWKLDLKSTLKLPLLNLILISIKLNPSDINNYPTNSHS